MRHSFGRSKAKGAPLGEVNMTNLIDVTMSILIIFILLAPVIEQGITISLPRTESKPKFDSPDPIVVSITKDNLYFQDQTITPEVLDTRLAVLASSMPEQAFIVRADRELEYEKVILIMDKLRKAGFRRLALATQSR